MPSGKPFRNRSGRGSLEWFRESCSRGLTATARQQAEEALYGCQLKLVRRDDEPLMVLVIFAVVQLRVLLPIVTVFMGLNVMCCERSWIKLGGGRPARD